MAELTVSTKRSYIDLGLKSGAIDVDASLADTQKVTVTGASQLRIVGVGRVVLVVNNPSLHALTFSGENVAGTAPISTIEFVYDGSSWTPLTRTPVAKPPAAVSPILGDWATSRESDIESRTFLNDTPLSISWAATMDKSVPDMDTYRISKCGTETKTTNWSGQDDPVFMFGYANNTYTTNQGWASDLVLNTGYKPGGAAQAASWPFIMAWTMTGSEFDVFGYGNAYDYAGLIEVNGRFVDAAPLRSGLPTGEWRLNVKFRSSATRTVRLWLDRGSVSGINVPKGTSVSKPAFSGRKVAVIGDSYTNGAGVSSDFPNRGASNFETYAARFARALDTASTPLLAGIGGTGWVAGGDTSSFRTRIPAVLEWNPDTLIIGGSINDDSSTTEQITAAAKHLLGLCTAVPKVYVVWTPFDGSSYWYRIRDALKKETVAANRTFFDLTGVMFGSGKIGAPTGDGTNDFYRMTDGVHPTLDAHKAMFRRIMALYSDTLK